jgi:AraC family transcriptional regulator
MAVDLLESEADGANRAWINRVIGLVDRASRQLERSSESAHFALIQATALLKEQVGTGVGDGEVKVRRGLLAWQVRKIREFVDDRISHRLLVSDLSSIVQMSEAHFSRLFKLTFGESPHAFILRRRLELAARLMLECAAPLSDIALQCGFTDQAHLCKQFRQAVKESPAAWRRAQRGVALQLSPNRYHRLEPAVVQAPVYGATAA